MLHAAVHTMSLYESRQAPGESTMAFAASIRGTATNCKLVKIGVFSESLLPG